MASKKYSAVVEVGGAVKGSFGSSMNSVQSGLVSVGDAVKKADSRFGEFSSGVAETETVVDKVGSVLQEMEARQGRIGDSLKLLSGDVSLYADELKDARAKMDLLNQYDPAAVRESGKAYRELKRDAAKLRKEYEAHPKPTKKMLNEVKRAEASAEKAGRAYKANQDKLASLGSELEKAGVDTKNLTGAHRKLAKQLDKSRKAYKKMSAAVEAGGKMKAQVGDLARTGGMVGASVVAGAAAVGTAVTMVNQATGEQVKLANALGVSAEEFQAWGGVAREAGFEVDTVGDLIEEMNNKLGESAGLEEITPVKESLEMLGLSFEELQDMAPEEQFKRIAEAIKAMPDGQQASAAADILMGGEANKFFGYLRTRKEGVDEIINQQKRLNVLSEEGRKGAADYNTAFSQMTTVVGSVAAEVSGLIGGALAPLISEYAPKLADYVRSHKDDLMGVGDAVRGMIPAVIDFGKGLYKVGSMVAGFISAVGGIENVAMMVGAVMAGKAAMGMVSFASSLVTVGQALPFISTGIKAIGAAVAANPIGLIVTAVVGGAMLIWKYWEPIKEFFSGLIDTVGSVVSSVGSFFGFGDDEEEKEPTPKVGDAVKKSVPVAEARPETVTGARPVLEDTLEVGQAYRQNVPVQIPPSQNLLQGVTDNSQNTEQKQTNISNKFEIQVHAAPGQSSEEIADEVMQRIEERSRDNSRLAMYDG
ncbi:phage tail tape measure protein [Maridesulfovibrio sp.]|uniref:phage tail tape measure protein n=1 Tax=Maridesulfovibrio sp. TaxID=2795000 RepID=UPI002A18B238|nr:phage tail tape measure protein [Maridesulfovibrio sp.]